MIFNPLKVFLNVSVASDWTLYVSALILFVSAHTYLFSVKYKNRYDEEGHKFVDFYRLQHAPVEKLEGYMLKDEARGIYKKEAGYEPEREWEEELPIDEDVQPQPGSSTDPDPLPPAFQEKIKLCQQIHDLQVEMLQGFGIDACRQYQENKIEFIIEAVQTKDTKCPLCHKQLKGGLAVKGHLRAKHMQSTPFLCSVCEKSFGNNQLLKSHMKTHDDPNKFACDEEGCSKKFPALGRLNAHKKTHQKEEQVKCKYCPKTFNAKKNLGPHEKTCKKRPDYDSLVRDKKCPHCPKAYFHNKDLKYHLKSAHASRAGRK